MSTWEPVWGLWAVTAAVYLAVMGPEGMKEMGKISSINAIMRRKKLETVEGIRLPYKESRGFMEFVINVDGTGKTVAEINKELLKYRIFGGYDLSRQMPSMGQSMLVCVTEKTDFSDIDTLAEALKKILSKEE